ncbi:MAG: 4-hydroxythreonine-4-phosphate dehydrogenase PdxA [Deltaproteobacteria bacterium]|nr:4-hydroxythreonine-4-phosphate dehydrogenase PdxA [Deltaproteobacteria bacterium]
MKPTFAITLGDPLGIGPEIVAKALKDPFLKKSADWKIFGTPRKKMAPREAGRASWQALEEAVRAIKRGECAGLVTAPVSKTHLHLAGFPYPGHTEFLADRFEAKKTAMMLASPKLRVVLVTIHLPLKKAIAVLSPSAILEKIILTQQSLKRDFGIRNPRIAVCGLNPHAGEGGLMGTEEKKIILPAIRRARAKKINATGPHSPDTVFHQAVSGEFDAVICHYHDQGLIPLKTLSFHEGVNVTLGLPIIRTSPDHGCAFDIAGRGIANPSSMKAAMRLILKLSN